MEAGQGCTAPSTARCASCTPPARQLCEPLVRGSPSGSAARPATACRRRRRRARAARRARQDDGRARPARLPGRPGRRRPPGRPAQQRRRPAARAQPGAAARGARRPAPDDAARLPRAARRKRGDEALAELPPPLGGASSPAVAGRRRDAAVGLAATRRRRRARRGRDPRPRRPHRGHALGTAGEAIDSSPSARAARKATGASDFLDAGGRAPRRRAGGAAISCQPRGTSSRWRRARGGRSAARPPSSMIVPSGASESGQRSVGAWRAAGSRDGRRGGGRRARAAPRDHRGLY